MSGLTTRTLLACFTLALACGDTDAGSSASAGSTSAASTGSTSTSTGSTGTAPGTTGAPTTSSPTTSASASSSSGEAPTTGAIDSTSTSTTTSDPSTTSTSTTDPGTSSTTSPGSSSDSGNGQPPPPPTMPAGCNVCDCCDPWPISWAAVPAATHYVVRWKCSINPEQVHDVGNKTAIADVCNDIEMCNGMCAFTVGYIKVQACNDDGCSALVDIPAAPITCGGGCCC